MQTIRIVALGKIKEGYLQAGLAEYSKRLGPLCKLHITELTNSQRILDALAADEYFIALDIRGQALSSTDLAAHLSQLALRGISRVTFGIGASDGLSDKVLNRADFRLSFGPMTFPHQLMRLILLEQIYRACKINRGEPYHK